MAEITALVEDFDGGTAGSVISTTNSVFDSITGTGADATFSASAAYSGPLGMAHSSTAAGKTFRANFASPLLWHGFYWRPVTRPATTTIVWNVFAGAAKVADVRWLPTGELELRSGTTTVWTSPVLALEWHRLAILTAPNATGTGQLRLRIYSGAGRDSSTPAHDSGAQVAAVAGTALDNVRIGSLTADTLSFHVDRMRADDAAEPAGVTVSGFTGAATFGGSGTVSTSGTPQPGAAAGFSGAGALAGAGAARPVGAADLAGSGTLTAAGAAAGTGAAALTSSGTLTASSSTSTSGAVDLSGSGTLAAAGTGAEAVAGHAALSGAGSLTETSTAALQAQATLTSTGTLTALGATATVGTVSLTGSGLLTATAATVVVTLVDLTWARVSRAWRADGPEIAAQASAPAAGWRSRDLAAAMTSRPPAAAWSPATLHHQE